MQTTIIALAIQCAKTVIGLLGAMYKFILSQH